MSLLVRRSKRAVMVGLLGLWAAGQYSPSWALSASDVVNNTVVDVTMIDGCGDAIPGFKNARGQNSRCWKKDGFAEPYPDKSSEICAYDNIGDRIEFSFNEVQVDDDRLESYLLVHDATGDKIFEKPIEARLFGSVFNLRRTVEWPLTSTAGPLNVGRNGKRYTANFERRIGDDVYYRSGTLEVFVDDCAKRQQEIVDLISDPSITHTLGFDLYLQLENEVATRICNTIKRGLVEYKNANFDKNADSFQQRCRTQCINNTFTNEIVNMAKQPNADNVLNEAHEEVKFQTAENIHLVENLRFGVNWFDERFMLVRYVTMEDNLRADGYCNCSGPLGPSDRDKSIDIIRESIDQIVVQFGLASLGDRLFRQVERHLDLTEALSNRQCGL